MNLGKLLAAGKSMMSGRTDVSYRSNKQIYLPKFESAKNPFKTEAAQPTRESAQAPSGTTVQSPATAMAARPLERELSAAPVKSAAVKTQKIPVMASPAKNGPGWAGKLNPIAMFRSAPEKKASAAGAAEKQQAMPLQPELSLNAVRVVHNDLSDADVEVVPIKSRSTPSEMQPAKKSWEFLGERLFGVETT